MKRCILIFLVALLGLQGCTNPPNDVRICGFGEGPRSRDAIIFDFADRLLIGSDSSSPFQIAKNEVAIGMISPIPLMLPLNDFSHAQIPATWEFSGYEFTATWANSADPDLLIIRAEPKDPRENNDSSSVLYSQSTGVLTIRTISFPEKRRLVQDFYSCGDRRLTASSFRAR